jgi:hypothetical protein
VGARVEFAEGEARRQRTPALPPGLTVVTPLQETLIRRRQVKQCRTQGLSPNERAERVW